MEEKIYKKQIKKINSVKNNSSKLDIKKGEILKNLNNKILDKRRISIASWKRLHYIKLLGNGL